MGFKNESLINTVELGRAIKRHREELKLSLRDVADLTEVSASTLSRIENGTGRPDADNIARLTQWLDMPVDRLMRHADESVEPASIIRTRRRLRSLRLTCGLTGNCRLRLLRLSELFRVAYQQFSKVK
ncbi:MAG: helix-turn-helix transcriptional regulator [Chloracidobacterium sp.]|nr:helix-turn-helix transcriptional regulator [Chloracidobacterium sp.]